MRSTGSVELDESITLAPHATAIPYNCNRHARAAGQLLRQLADVTFGLLLRPEFKHNARRIPDIVLKTAEPGSVSGAYG
jgi:hypothetical protein